MSTTNSVINTTNPIGVASGGTSLATLTAHAVQVGAGTSAITQIGVGASGSVLLGATGADPAFATLTSTGGSITYTTGANSLNIDVVNYATGTFTPTLEFGGASVGITYSVQTGIYTRIGNVVYITAAITLTNKGSSTGAMTCPGLPYTSNATYNSQLNIRSQNITFTSDQIIATITANTSALLTQRIVSGGGVNTSVNTEYANNSAFIITGCYFV